MAVRTWGGDVGAQVAELSRPEASRLEIANRVEDPGERLAALAALADELTIERAQADGVLDREGRARRRLGANEIAHRYGDVRAAVFAGHEEDERAAEAAMLRAIVPVEGSSHQARLDAQAAMLAHGAELVRTAGLSREETERLLQELQTEFGPRPERPETGSTPEIDDVRPSRDIRPGRRLERNEGGSL